MFNNKSNEEKSKNAVNGKSEVAGNSVAKCVRQCKKRAKGRGSIGLWDEYADEQIKDFQTEILLHAVKDNGGVFYPLSFWVEGMDRDLLHRIICSLFTKNAVYEDVHRTVRVAPIIMSCFKLNGFEKLVDWLSLEL